jgi:hypothetical protein
LYKLAGFFQLKYIQGGSFMKKNKSVMRKVLGFIVFVLVLLVSACSNDGGRENTDPKLLKITGMGDVGASGFIVGMFSAMPEAGEPENEITGFGVPSNGEVTIELKVGSNPQAGSAWIGTGSYFVNAIDTTE